MGVAKNGGWLGGRLMENQKWHQAKALFIKATGLSKSEKEAFIEVSTKDDPELKEILQGLLSGDEMSQDAQSVFTELVSQQADELIIQSFKANVGDQFGVYKVQDVIGEGGMGAVYLGQRNDGQFEQTVAIKVIHGRNLTSDSVSRFRQERQILATLQHPNIGKLIDGGETQQGFPYIIMEYISGLNIVEYCRVNKLDVSARLRLFKQVANAVVYAHQNLVIHRDIKPSNVIVDERGNVKLLDFGIAKLIDREASTVIGEKTDYEMRLLSPVNASPEQVRNEAPTTVTDVYGLGTLLYQMMTELPLFNTQNISSRELEDCILDKVPTRPSENLSTTHSIKNFELASTLSGDLDTIILKTLQKEPQRRYASVEQLESDVQRYLTNFPILAKPDSKAYTFKKFVQRNKASSMLASIFAVSLLIFIGTLSYQSYVIQLERDRAVREANNAYQISEFLKETFQAANPYVASDSDVSPKDLLDGASKRIQGLEGDLLLKAQLNTTLADVYRSLADYTSADKLAQRAQEIYDNQPSVNPILRAQQSILLSTLAYEKGQIEESYALLEPLLAQLNSMLDDNTFSPQRSQIADLLATTLLNQGTNQLELGQEKEGIASIEAALNLFSESTESNPSDLAYLFVSLGDAYKSVFRFEDAEKALLKAVDNAKIAHGDRHLQLAHAYNQLASVYNSIDRVDEALEMAKASFDIRSVMYKEPHPELGASLGMLARLYTRQKDYEQALKYRQQSLEVIRAVFGGEHYYVGATELGVANLYMRLERLEEAEALTLLGQNRLIRLLPAGHIDTARGAIQMGKIRYQQKRYQNALELLVDGLNIAKNAQPNGHWITGEAHAYLALNHFAVNNLPQAISHKQNALAIYMDIFGQGSERALFFENLLEEIPTSAQL
jgi:serine/threonine-protein kinase